MRWIGSCLVLSVLLLPNVAFAEPLEGFGAAVPYLFLVAILGLLLLAGVIWGLVKLYRKGFEEARRPFE
jgi:hypothetical protein